MAAKKRKPANTKPASRRSSRRVKAQGGDDASVAGPESPAPTEASSSATAETHKSPEDSPAPSTATSISNPDLPLLKQCVVPVVALHKKFGKYLINDANFSKKIYEVGSDSETNSSVEIRVVDPCASSESDSNTALDVHSDNASGVSSFSPMNSANNPAQDSPLDDSTTPSTNIDAECKENYVEQCADVPTESGSVDDVEIVEDYQMPTEATSVEEATDDYSHSHIPMLEDHEDDEIITIFQIVEDDNPEVYYKIDVESPKASPSNDDNAEALNDSERDFQEHFQNLNLSGATGIYDTSIDISEQTNTLTDDPCIIPDVPTIKDTTADILRPDPSLTPSSTLSDDSNSSRVPSELNDSAESSPTGVRRSSRIKTISTLKQKTKGYGLVKTPLKKALMSQTKLKLEEMSSDSSERTMCDAMSSNSVPNSPTFPIPSEMPVKVKSRWRRSSELEMGCNSPAVSPLASPSLPQLPSVTESQSSEDMPKESVTTKEDCERIINERMNQFEHLDENEYQCDRMISKDAKKMICDCFLTNEEIERGELGCGEDCLNRLLMIECNCRCPVGDRCTNRRFQKRENALLTVFYADKKGCGVEAGADFTAGEFLMEYVGEVLDYDQFYKRAQSYSDDNNLHHYFMSLKGDTVIDATLRGNISRFINHSCDPNAETQKWTVNGELRIGFFSKRDIAAGEEITFDYQFQRFGKEAQRCYCGTTNCRGWIGAEPDSDEDDEEEEEVGGEEDDVSTSKSASERRAEARGEGKAPRRRRRPKRDRKYVPPAPDAKYEDADIEADLESLSRTGVKNQSHTLLVSRTTVRAKGRRAQTSLLRLLRDADLPCRRLFLDYRGLRLLAPWGADAPLDFRLEMLQTLDRLPIPNKTTVQESRFFTIVERWLVAASEQQENIVSMNETSGVSDAVANGAAPVAPESADKQKETAVILQKVKDLSKQLLERWSNLKEVFKIPKKERIQQMKEHERQANVERRAADSSGGRERERERERERRDARDKEHRERDRERERHRERDRDRDRDKDRDRDRDDRDRRKRRSSPEGRRSIRLGERVLASVPPMSKEERRRAFAEAAAVAERGRRPGAETPSTAAWPPYPHWQQDAFPSQMFPPGMMGGPPGMLAAPPSVMAGGMIPPGMMGMMPPGDVPPEWGGPAGPPPGFCPPFCIPQPNFMGMGGFQMGGFMFPPQLGAPSYQELPAPSTIPAAVAPCTTSSEVTSGNVAEVGTLPSMWRSARDDRGRVYYYHVKARQPQWAPPPPPLLPTPDLQGESSEEEEVEEESVMDTTLVRRQSKGKLVEGVSGLYEVIKEDKQNGLIPDHALVNVKPRKRRPGLVTERPISPRTEEDKLAGKLEVKRYKETKEKLRRKRERLLQKVKLLQRHASKRSRRKRELTMQEVQMIEVVDSDSDTSSSSVGLGEEEERGGSAVEAEGAGEAETEADVARRIKEMFLVSMARVMVQHLDPYRHSGAPTGRITCTADFKHLARKLTHFVMLKELKHCRSVQELVCTESVRNKAREFVRKYMAKFGAIYRRPPEEAD